MSFGSEFIFTLITNDPEVARRADAAKVNYIGLDFEILGKRQRQKEPSAWISDHKLSELPAIRETLKTASLFARTNPLHNNSEREVETLLSHGVQSLMLPMFRTAEEVERFVRFVDGRAEVCLLLETPEALFRLHDICEVDGIDEINAGLNDLHRALGLKSHFEILVSDLFATLADNVNEAGIRFGFGTLGRVGDQGLPISPDLICAQYPRLNAVSARLFRYFLGADPLGFDMSHEVAQLRQRLDYWHDLGPQAQQDAMSNLRGVFGALPDRVASS